MPRSNSAADPALEVAFQHRAIGEYGCRAAEEDFGGVTFLHGVAAGRVAVVEDPERGRVLRVYYPAGRVGPEGGGAEFRVRLPVGGDDLRCGYWVRFGEGFDFVRGGKLPGLAGGTAPTGGARATGTNGFSARLMWRAGGAAVQYLYHPEQTGVWGDDLPYATKSLAGVDPEESPATQPGSSVAGPSRFRPGRWHHVEHRVRLNTPGEGDGLVQAWFDGEPALERRGLRFRDAAAFTIDQLFFSTFFGGNDASWAPTKDEHVDFDGFVVRATPVGDSLRRGTRCSAGFRR